MIATVEKYGATWCHPCKALDKTLDYVKEKFPGLKFTHFDADDDPEVFETMKIKNIPLMIFRDESGKEVHRITGNVPVEDIIEAINM